ncbi:hypothetical protein QBC32DRAFT_271853 [Pseudoneurospora amorphoporcata]|uniref:Uncharacterized protein n=1 Tax=Pseudoneurospora amorphoporcata TaxID=241081 RepID=A0AAN6NJ55_9PEZI|nr:hypothetical protein QBC32DRAFT_271853 [Pseudoneurospora amorphoporcata]
MPTTALFLRNPSTAIQTAGSLRSILARSFTVIARSGFCFQPKGESSITCVDRSRQEKSQTWSVLPNLNVFARPFHTSAVCRTDSDQDSNDWRNWLYGDNTICAICKVNQVDPTKHQYTRIGDPKDDVSGWAFERICVECDTRRLEGLQKKPKKTTREKRLMLKEAKKRLNEMLEYVKSVPPGEKVPIVYAVKKLRRMRPDVNARVCKQITARMSRQIREWFGEELLVVQVGNRWMCDRGRVDMMDFSLWYYDSDLSVQGMLRRWKMEGKTRGAEAPSEFAGDTESTGKKHERVEVGGQP